MRAIASLRAYATFVFFLVLVGGVLAGSFTPKVAATKAAGGGATASARG